VSVLGTIGLCLLNVGIALLLSPLVEGLMRKLKAALQSRIGPPVYQPYLDLLKLLGKEDLRTSKGWLDAAGPALALGYALALALLAPMGTAPPLGFAGDLVALLYVATTGAAFVVLTGFASGSTYAFVGGSREIMLLLTVEPVMAVALVVGAFKAGTLAVGDLLAWQAGHGPTISMAIAGFAFFLALQAQAGRIPFDIAEADQEIMGGPLVEQSGPRLALFRWALWARQLVLAFVLVELFLPWPRLGWLGADLVFAFVKVGVVLVLVTVVDVVNPRLRIDQALAYYLRVVFGALAGLAFAAIGM
jgi:formate hydrogenlyase subunit 4